MATANGNAAGATPARRDLQSIPLRGHTVYVWRQPEPTKHAFAWRVVADTDQREEVAAGEADDSRQAWEQAIAIVGAVPAPKGVMQVAAAFPKASAAPYRSAGDLFRDLGDRALKGMTRAELMRVAEAGALLEESALNLADLAEGLGCLIAADSMSDLQHRSGSLQGRGAFGAFGPLADGIRNLEAVAYVSGFAALMLLQPETYGAAIDGEDHHG